MDQAGKDPKDPSSTSDEYDVMAPRWALAEDLLGGTEAMRAAGEAHLPRHQDEQDITYRSRLKGTTLLNMFQHTLDTLVGKPFSNPIKVSEKVPPEVLNLLSDVDLQGNNLDVFCRAWFREAMAKGFCHVLIDYPRKDENVKTLDDQRNAGLRPYFVLVKPENLRAARYETINGQEVLIEVRILEVYKERIGFIDVSRRRVRVLTPGFVTLFAPKLDAKGQEVQQGGRVVWEQQGEPVPTDIPAIPLVTFYATKDGFMICKPPLQDLAHLNVEHWQSSSDQRHILTVSRFPILACSGAAGGAEDDSDDLTIGPNKILYNRDPQGRFYYVEHQGNAIEAGRKDLESIEDQMASYGAQFLRKKPGNQTATAAALDSSEARSDLAAMVIVFKDIVAHALYWAARWMGKELPDDGANTVDISLDWTDGLAPMRDNLQTLRDARDKEEISRLAYVNTLKEIGILPEDYDAEEDAEQIAAEAWIKITPQMLQQLLALQQAKELAPSELRAILRKAMIATLDDEAAKNEMESTLDYGPGAKGAVNPNLPPEEKVPENKKVQPPAPTVQEEQTTTPQKE